jgi:hypothetical protein
MSPVETERYGILGVIGTTSPVAKAVADTNRGRGSTFAQPSHDETTLQRADRLYAIAPVPQQ